MTDNIKYLGVNDKDIDLFEGMYDVPNGMAYNSYAIIDEKIAIFDSVDARKCNEWLSNINTVLNGKAPDYLVVLHMEPDHSGSIIKFTETYPNAKIVSSQKSFAMMKNFYGNDFSDRQLVASEGFKLCLGEHNVTFYAAPMVHWPEVLVAYEEKEKILFSADAFGKFGALDADEDWACEARRYYFGIVGKYGAQVQLLLKKLSGLEINAILPLHGPLLTENIGFYVNLYNIWSSYGVESEGVFIAYTSVYGNTKKAAELLAKTLEEKGCVKVAISDLARSDMAENVEDAFRYGKLVLATTTYNGEIFPFMNDFINRLTERNIQNKTIGFIENGSWAPMATKVMKTAFEKCKNLTFTQTNVKILSSVSEQNKAEIQTLADELL